MCIFTILCQNVNVANQVVNLPFSLIMLRISETSTVSCFCLTKQKGSVVLILLALQSNSTGSVLTYKGALDVGIRELKPGVAAPLVIFAVSSIVMLLLLVTRPLPRDEGMAEYHGAPEAGQLSRVWTRGRNKTESRQE